MAQNPFHDIVPPGRRTIRNVPKNRPLHTKRPPQWVPPQAGSKLEQGGHIPRTSGRGIFSRIPGSSRFNPWVIAGSSFVVLIIIFSFLFSGAKVIVTPKQNNIFVDAHFEARREASLTGLMYESMSIEKEGSQTVKATGEEDVEIKASGNIVIFNNFDGAIQRLVKNTRFETPDNLIYRIDKSVVVPGKTTKNGKVIPGSIEVTVYADEPGEGYNIGLTDFTIPGFKGGPRFEGFFARSKTPMTGGFIGKKLVVEQSELEKTKEAIQNDLEKQLLLEAFAQKPEGFYLYENAIFIEFESLPSVEKGRDVEIKERATLYGVLFEKEKFARYIALNTIGGFDDNPVEIIDADTLTFTILNKESSRPWEDDSFTFTLNGNAQIVWTFDFDQLRSDLLGRSKDALPTVLSGYPSIEQAEVIVRPFWKRVFPLKPSKIKIERVLEQD